MPGAHVSPSRLRLRFGVRIGGASCSSAANTERDAMTLRVYRRTLGCAGDDPQLEHDTLRAADSEVHEPRPYGMSPFQPLKSESDCTANNRTTSRLTTCQWTGKRSGVVWQQRGTKQPGETRLSMLLV
jgi:hypothetical protein